MIAQLKKYGVRACMRSHATHGQALNMTGYA